jgi:hypothetical protein
MDLREKIWLSWTVTAFMPGMVLISAGGGTAIFVTAWGMSHSSQQKLGSLEYQSLCAPCVQFDLQEKFHLLNP